ncbi:MULTISPECIES: hypothetical protein [Pectobacterium]|nr:hypothetical protein [Pectobacterium brasiliense]
MSLKTEKKQAGNQKKIKIVHNLIRINREIAHNNVDNYSLMP